MCIAYRDIISITHTIHPQNVLRTCLGYICKIRAIGPCAHRPMGSWSILVPEWMGPRTYFMLYTFSLFYTMIKCFTFLPSK